MVLPVLSSHRLQHRPAGQKKNYWAIVHRIKPELAGMVGEPLNSTFIQLMFLERKNRNSEFRIKDSELGFIPCNSEQSVVDKKPISFFTANLTD